jgi:Ca2+-binding RTX toxin-like protein
MFHKRSIGDNPFGILLIATMVGILTTVGMVLPTSNLAEAANILCNSTELCLGSDSADKMVGDSQNNQIVGCGDDDIISGSAGNDLLVGDIYVSGCPSGFTGADRISGGAGDDAIFHQAVRGLVSPDGHTDLIDCGPGNDVAWINVSVDHDIAVNCETIHAG